MQSQLTQDTLSQKQNSNSKHTLSVLSPNSSAKKHHQPLSQNQSPQKYSSKIEKTKISVNPQGDLHVALKQIKEYEIEITHLRTVQRANDNSDDISESLKQEIESLRARLEESEKARTDLQEQLVSSAQIDKDSGAKDDKYKSLIIKENEDLRSTISRKDNELREKDSRIDYLRQIINENELEKQEMKIIVEETLSKSYSQESTVYESETKRVALQNEYERSLYEYTDKLKKHYEMIEDLTKENEVLKQRIRDLEAQISQLGQQQIETLTLLKQEQDKSKKVVELEKLTADMKQQRDLLMKHIESLNKEKEQLLEKYRKLQEETQKMLLRMKEEFTKFQSQREQLEKELFEKDEELVKKDAVIKNLTSKQLEMSEQVQKFQKFLEANKDLKRQLDHLNNENSKLRDDKTKLEQNLTDSNKLLQDSAFGSSDAAGRIRELEDKIREQQEELEAMKKLVSSLRQRYQIYIPESKDEVDEQLAEYINNYPERSNLRIMFMRESSGVYHFGSRRVYVRVERDKISVRVGGGYLSIDEFLDIYTPMELERLERNDPIKKFSEKVAVQKTLMMTSPVRSPGPQTRELGNNGQIYSNNNKMMSSQMSQPTLSNEKKRFT